MEKIIRVFADGALELRFDGERAVVSRLDVGYPEIRRVVSALAAPRSETTAAIAVGGGELILEGYFLDRERGEGAPGLRALLSSIAAPGRKFTLAVGERRRELFAKELRFAAEAPFATGLCEKFTLTAFSDDPYFHAGERVFLGEAAALDRLALPAAIPGATGSQWSAGSVTVENDGEMTCGVIIEVGFTSAAAEFHLRSDREAGRMYMGRSFSAGDRVVIDTTPGQKSVRTAAGTSLLDTIDEGCAFFSAPPGATVFRYNSYSDTPPTVRMRITPGYLGV